MAEKMKGGPTTPVRQHRFDGDSRPNIPTAELESFARPGEKGQRWSATRATRRSTQKEDDRMGIALQQT